MGTSQGEIERRGTKEFKDERSSHSLDCGDRVHGYIHMSKLIKVYTLSMCSILCANYASISLLFKRRLKRFADARHGLYFYLV